MCDIALKVERTGVHVYELEILHSTPLSQIFGFNITDRTPVDNMYVGPEGVAKRLMRCWCEKSNHVKPHYIGSELNAIDSVPVN